MAGLSPTLRRIVGMGDNVARGSDDVIDTIRAAKLAREAEAADFLRKLQGEQTQWQSRFGFDPDRLYPKDNNVQVAGRRLDMGTPLEPDMSLGSPGFDALYKAAGQYDQLRSGRTANLRNQPFAGIAGQSIRDADEAAALARVPGRMDAAKKAGAAALGAAGVGLMVAPTPLPEEPAADAGDLTESGNPAELRDEPVSTAAPDAPPPAAPQPTDYAYEARQILQKLNAMRRAAGGEVPQAQEMIAQANKLLAMADQQRNAPGYEPAMPTDYHGQATLLIQKLNQMRRAAGGEVPQAGQIMAEVRRLQAMGDKQRWN